MSRMQNQVIESQNVFAACGIQLQLEAHHRQERIVVSNNAALMTVTGRIFQEQRRAGTHLRLSPSLASNSISPLKKNTHMRMGDGWVSPTQPAGSLRNPHCEAGASSETKNGVAGGAKSLLTTSTDSGSKCDAPFVSGRKRTKLSGAAIKVPRCTKAQCGNVTAGAVVENMRGSSLRLGPDNDRHADAGDAESYRRFTSASPSQPRLPIWPPPRVSPRPPLRASSASWSTRSCTGTRVACPGSNIDAPSAPSGRLRGSPRG
jgi:hypothetical protein